MMRTSDRGIALIKAHEGLRLDAYPDAGYGWARATIGYGHTSQAGPPTVSKGMRITAVGAEAILRSDLQAFERYVNSAVHVPLSQPQFDALVSFTFNLGPPNLRKSTLLRKLNAGDYRGAADEFQKWTNSNNKVLPGLVRRRSDEREMFLSGTYDLRPPVKPVLPRPVEAAPPAPSAPPQGLAPVAVLVVIAIAVAVLIFGG